MERINSPDQLHWFCHRKTEDAIKEALFAKRTAAVFNKTNAGKEELLRKLFLTSVKFEKIKPLENRYILINKSDLEYKIISEIKHILYRLIKPYGLISRRME